MFRWRSIWRRSKCGETTPVTGRGSAEVLRFAQDDKNILEL
jgi:hypothetical protein